MEFLHQRIAVQDAADEKQIAPCPSQDSLVWSEFNRPLPLAVGSCAASGFNK
jgi:hypothetical protein